MVVKDLAKAREGKAHFKKSRSQISDQRLYRLASVLEMRRA